jgi:pyridoxal phosphate-dependent aminotransferase EpsN
MGAAERELLLEAFDSNWIAPLGPHVDAFEQECAEYLGAKDAAALSSGTAAIHLAFRLLGIGEGDKVYAPSFTFCASINPVLYVGATPVLIDSERDTWGMDPELLAEELEKDSRNGTLPKAVLMVHIYGQASKLEEIALLCAKYGVILIEDAAEAMGTKHNGKHVGTSGRIGLFSFNGNKIITTSGGGLLVSEDVELVAKARHLASQARMPGADYEHDALGYNYRMSNLLAAVGRGQLRLLEDRVAARRANFEDYRARLGGLEGITFLEEPEGDRGTRWLSVLRIDADAFGAGPEQVRLALEDLDIESRPLWMPMHMQSVFRDARMVGGSVCEELYRTGLCLPSGSALKPADRERVMDAVEACAVPGIGSR